MGKRKDEEKRSIRAWYTAKTAPYKDTRFNMIGASIYLEKEFQKLSGNAFKLYQYMGIESGGSRYFTFTRTDGLKYGMDNTTLRRAVAELVKAGFIIAHSNGNIRKPNNYEFVVDREAQRQKIAERQK